MNFSVDINESISGWPGCGQTPDSALSTRRFELLSRKNTRKNALRLRSVDRERSSRGGGARAGETKYSCDNAMTPMAIAVAADDPTMRVTWKIN